MGATLCQAPGTATRGPQSGDRLLSRCRPQRSPVPGRAVAQTIRFCSEARPAKPLASRRSVATKGQGEPLTPSAPWPCPCGPLLPASKRPWDPGVRCPSRCPRGEKGEDRWNSQAATYGRGHTRGGRGCWCPRVGKATGRPAAADSGPSPHPPQHLSSGVALGSCSTPGSQVLCKAAPRV